MLVLENVRSALSPDPTDFPWVSQDVTSKIAENNARTKFGDLGVVGVGGGGRGGNKISFARLDDAVTKFLSTYKHGGGTVVEKWICTLLIMNFINAKWQLRLIQMEV